MVWRTIFVLWWCLSPNVVVVVVVGLANVEMVLPNLSGPQRGYGNIEVIIVSRALVLLLVEVCAVGW